MHEGTTQGNLGKEITPNKENETWPNRNPLRLDSRGYRYEHERISPLFPPLASKSELDVSTSHKSWY
jgi:hypothetical protein